MTEVLLLVVALLLCLACGVFVAAEFSLTTVERSELEQAVERGERGAESALVAVRSLTFQLSGAQLGITVTGLVIGMISKPSIAALLKGPFQAMGLSPGAASSTALVLGPPRGARGRLVGGARVAAKTAVAPPRARAPRV
ncbi:CNNM domain-containing protein, partial [Streptomyces goshikiensis]